MAGTEHASGSARWRSCAPQWAKAYRPGVHVLFLQREVEERQHLAEPLAVVVAFEAEGGGEDEQISGACAGTLSQKLDVVHGGVHGGDGNTRKTVYMRCLWIT